ncbi:MAG: hypothetical protein VXY23_15200 [Pseudomonadota bacterium]|nr:hypothetical protein [Pseudomonadota bacterium]
MNDKQLRCEVVDVNFVHSSELNEEGALLTFDVSNGVDSYLVISFVIPRDDGEWVIRKIHWVAGRPLIDEDKFAKFLVNTSEKILRTTNFWSGEQLASSAKMFANQKRVSDEDIGTNSISNRFSMLEAKYPPWEELWQRIENRVNHDEYFRVHGFDKDQVLSGIQHLKSVFPWEWVKARYREGPFASNPPLMSDGFPPEGHNAWFPAYHLARTALGSICVDPGWNYLIEIGLSISELSGFNKIDVLTNKLTNSPGTQHHLCFAAELYRKGYLLDLEPPTGSGNASNDLLARINNDHFSIEVKEFTPNNPIKKLRKELADKIHKLPKNTTDSVVFHIVLREEGDRDVIKEQAFFGDVQSISREIHDLISAVVVGSRFVDASGGRVKRETKGILLNENAKNPASSDSLAQLFENNFDEIVYPCHGIGTFFYAAKQSEPDLRKTESK